MKKVASSKIAKFFGLSKYDSIGFDEQFVRIAPRQQPEISIQIELIKDFNHLRGWFWDSFVFVLSNGQKYQIDGLSSEQAKQFVIPFEIKYTQTYYLSYLKRIEPLLSHIPSKDVYWRRKDFLALSESMKADMNSFTYRKILPIEDVKAKFDIAIKIASKKISVHKEHNRQFIEYEMQQYQDFFDKIETRPLTAKQREAVLINERSNLIIAGAGSGKTSVMVSKVGYVLQKYGVDPKEILLLAFNKSAAEELQERIGKRLNLDTVKTSTFHAIGLEIIGQAFGKKPSLAKSAEDDKELEKLLLKLLEKISFTEPAFSKKVNIFLTYPFAEYKSKDTFTSDTGYALYLESNNIRTLRQEKVKSYEEAEIANFLFSNGIEYQYEAKYEHDTATSDYRQYQPDFYLPDYGIYIEHFGIDEKGNTAPFVNKQEYNEGIIWKRELHKQHNTRLIETYSYEKHKGVLTSELASKLQAHGVELKPRSALDMIHQFDNGKNSNPILKLFATFLGNFKSNQHTEKTIRIRAGDNDRINSFVDVFIPLVNAYENHLQLNGEIDFNDMILQAIHAIQSGKYQSQYRYILVDEFQDISVSRANLVKALLEQNSSNILTAVGDDWQSINRFAGSDISIFKDFDTFFGDSDSVSLDYTFRYNDKIAKVSQLFIEKNPSQINKPVKTLSEAKDDTVFVWWNDEQETLQMIDRILLSIIEKNETSSFSVFLLARYWGMLPKGSDMIALKNKYPFISFNISSVHASKGLEADYVIGLGIDSGTFGFPSAIVDDPIVDIVLAKQENFRYAEERRLFYVLLTRAKHEVHIIASSSNMSEFALELKKEIFPVCHIYPNDIEPTLCSSCGSGTLIKRKKNNSVFFGCSNYPACKHTEAINICTVCGQGNMTLSGNKRLYVCNKVSCRNTASACPSCKGILIKRRNKIDNRPFYGCSNFKNGCKFTKPI
ncbi:MAG: UvrD-helicase domain-containing protein [Paludibacter sp.]|nr:UvrD-helicase domain-containing protein [Paludibacter sp.]